MKRFAFIKSQFLFGFSWTIGDPLLVGLLGKRLWIHIGPFTIAFGKDRRNEISGNVQDP